MSILQKIADIESEMARTQKNKATSGHLGLLKAKLAKLRREIIEPKSGGGGGGKGEGFGFLLFYWVQDKNYSSSSSGFSQSLSSESLSGSLFES